MDMLAEGYDVYMLADAISSRSLYNKEIALRELRAEGAHLTTVEMALFFDPARCRSCPVSHNFEVNSLGMGLASYDIL